MSVPQSRYVVDASVGIKLFLAEPLSDKADLLFDQLAANPPADLLVPDLFFIECANILWKHVRRYGYAVDRARRDLSDLAMLALQSVPTWELARSALDIALAHGITTYDACYVALAQRERIALVTADENLVRQLTKTPYRVIWLADLVTDR